MVFLDTVNFISSPYLLLWNYILLTLKIALVCNMEAWRYITHDETVMKIVRYLVHGLLKLVLVDIKNGMEGGAWYHNISYNFEGIFFGISRFCGYTHKSNLVLLLDETRKIS